jgi:hypothetical protein
VYSHVYCGHSLFGGNYSLVDFDPTLGLDFPDSPKFDYLKYRLKFDDLDDFQFNMKLMERLSPCKLPFLESGEVPNDIKD